MEAVTVSELNQQTRRVLDRIKAGESVDISEYGQPIARLIPVTPTTGVAVLDQLILQGRAIPATMPGPIPPTPPLKDWERGKGPLSDEIIRMRNDERY